MDKPRRTAYQAQRRDYSNPFIRSEVASSAQTKTIPRPAPVNPVETPKPIKKLNRAYLIAGLVFLCLGVVFVGLYATHLHSSKTSAGITSPPISASDSATAHFTLFYPKPLPSGYKLVGGSNKLGGVVYSYRLAKGTKIITVSQQPADGQTVNLSQLKNLVKVKNPIGNEAAGLLNGQPFAIVTTSTTTITIIGLNDTPVSDVTAASIHLQAAK